MTYVGVRYGYRPEKKEDTFEKFANGKLKSPNNKIITFLYVLHKTNSAYLKQSFENQNITQPAVLKQFNMFLNYIDVEFSKVDSPPKTPEEMITFIKNLHDESVISIIPKNDVNLISQLKMNASTQLAEHWAQRWNGEMSPEVDL